MIIYNVTVKVNSSRTEEWLEWMNKKHIPEMMQTDLFTDYSIHRLLEQDDSDGRTFVIQYFTESLEDYHLYLDRHADIMRKKSSEKFGQDALAFRTLMETIDRK